MAIALRYAARSDVGLVRASNQDSGYAGPHLLVIADGMGGHAGGDVASSLAVGALSVLDGEAHGADDAADHLGEAIEAANEELRRRIGAEPELAGMGTTVTAILRSGERLVLAHIGDSRGYLLRDGVLTQLTRDHSYVQSLVDAGRLTPEDAENHPQRSVLLRVLTGAAEDHADVSVRTARSGDRFLLCSDGLSGVVAADTLATTLIENADPGAAAERLVELALRGGGPDNISVVVADVVDIGNGPPPATTPQVVGAAAFHRPRRSSAFDKGPGTAASRGAMLGRDADDGPDDEDAEAAARQVLEQRRRRRRRRFVALGSALLVVLLAGGAWGAWTWSQQQFFVGAVTADGRPATSTAEASTERVALFRGLAQDIGPVQTARVVQGTDIVVAQLPPVYREQVEERVSAPDRESAEAIIANLRTLWVGCLEQAAAQQEQEQEATPTPSGSPTTTGVPASPSASPSATPSATVPSTIPTTPIPSGAGAVGGCGGDS
ncbi:PP2C family protein-serine/threonine phosphatase [Kineococcus gynurae]|uniref:PP2C family protein-serine/threonine phosphatase n=1 Tax=Kineococcus gynurae TaxID=452979 RepID=A0ABV5LSW7_9ACTN